MSDRLSILRACVALRVAMGHLEKAEGVDDAIELLLLAGDLLNEKAGVSGVELEEACRG